jgi:hypothetical protein
MIPQTNHQWLLVLQIEQGVSDFFFIAYVHFVYQLIGTASGFFKFKNKMRFSFLNIKLCQFK